MYIQNKWQNPKKFYIYIVINGKNLTSRVYRK